MKHGSILSERPAALAHLNARAADTAAFKPIDWFKDHPPDGDPLGNDDFGCCDPAADFRLIQLWGGECDQHLVLNRYSQLTGFSAAVASSDQGTDTNLDLRSWCAFPIFDGKVSWPIYWAQVAPVNGREVLRALQRVPLLGTIILPKAIDQSPEKWADPPGSGDDWIPSEAHRVVIGGWDGTFWKVRTWGMDVKVHPMTMGLLLSGGIVDVAIPHPACAPEALYLELSA